MVNITAVDLLALATSIPYANQLSALSTTPSDTVQFLSYNTTFATDILGPNVSQSLIANETWEAFHEAGIYNQATNSLYIASNWAGNFSNPINITILNLSDYSISSTRYTNLAEANGACPYYPPGTPANSSTGQQMLFCDEGDLVNPSQLTLVDPVTNETKVLLNNFLGKNFSSLNDVEQHPVTGDLWFTDARYGYWQSFRPEPVIRPQVYRFSPSTGVVQVVADDFIAPNGIEFSPDFKAVYVTDSGSMTFANETANPLRPATVYKFDVSSDGTSLLNRRVFAYSDYGIPDGIHTDTQGNVYSGCGDGVHVWNPQGVLLGKMIIEGGTNNFAFVPGGVLIFNGNRLFKVGLAAEGRAVKRDFGLSR